MDSKTFVFVFPMASGHLNPSLPIARSLRELGHTVHYVCLEQMREAIEGTGALFHSAVDIEPELYEGRTPDPFGANTSLGKEYGLSELFTARLLLQNVQIELQLPGLVRFLQSVSADAVICCPLFNFEAIVAAKSLNIPSISIVTIAGPGALVGVMQTRLESMGLSWDGVDQQRKDFLPDERARANILQKYGVCLQAGLPRPYGLSEALASSTLNIVTTCEDLQDPVSDELAEAYASRGAQFASLGALLDKAGSKRAGVHKLHQDSTEKTGADETFLLERVRLAKRSGRPVIVVSMGTVITGDAPMVGWESRPTGPDGTERGLRGQELCRAAWGGAIDAFGSSKEEDGPLLILTMGPQKDALGDLDVPSNAICTPCIPQVDLLEVGVDVFLTHGGQNSFTEALAKATPIVVCPGFGDQVINAAKAEKLGVGMKVDRPMCDVACAAEAARQYRVDVRDALKTVLDDARYKAAAEMCAERLRNAGGTEKAVELVTSLVKAPSGAIKRTMPVRHAGA
eukprot:TRINITY_DN23716_c0_g1_i1.p1 TRINITY_DN23716_c0_g1~~TRINITY_DN23716_c0_g1_i1.p1  ORF type:complete len:514 (-),score=85.17 TRINITY_DN23716_c0_g1_i1:247-1788(-)